MKILHTADWHLGHQLHGHERRFEHDSFLDWLTDTIKQRQIDALLVAGDLFDTANPPPAPGSSSTVFWPGCGPRCPTSTWC